jgi:hypothetical protein
MITWGQLAKSQTDPEKIEEAIQRLINEHNADPEAHLVEGGSLKSHKMAEIIDHLVNSIIADKIRDGTISGAKLTGEPFIIYTIFESPDGWDIFSDQYTDVVFTLGGASLKFYGGTGSRNHYCYAIAIPFGGGNGMDPTKNPIFETVARVPFQTNHVIYFVMGDKNDQAFGFKVLNGVLYALHVKDGVEYTTQITGIDITNWNKFRAVFTSGQKIEFFVNDELKATHTTNLPTASVDFLFHLYLKGTDEYENRIDFRYLLASQKK